MAIMTKDEAQTILKKVLSYSKAEACEVNLNGSVENNIRYARNTVTTSGTVNDMNLAVASSYGKRQGTATVNEFDDASLGKVVKRAEELAKLAPENPELMPPLGPQEYKESKAWFDSTANLTPEYRAQAASHSIKPCREKKLIAAGFLNDDIAFQAMANSKGLMAYHASTSVNFNLTVRTEDGTGSGWVSRDTNDAAKLDTKVASAIAMEKAAMSREAKAIEPGKYTVILEPAAAAGLLRFMFFSFNARTADEGRSFLAKKGGGNKVGEKIVDERVTLYSDPLHPEVPAATWQGDGLARKKIAWLEKGVVKNMFYQRYWAEKQDKEPVPRPSNNIMEGGTESIEDLVKSTKKGILVTRTWYNRMVDPQSLLVTGLTRDGTFFIEDGKISFPVKNFRFNESPVIMLNNIETLGKPMRTGRNMIPPMKLRDFTFTSLSDAV